MLSRAQTTPDSDSLATLTAASLSLLATATAHPTSPAPSPSTTLASLRAIHSQLHAQLEHALNVGVARRKAALAPAASLEEEHDGRENTLKRSIDHLRVQVEEHSGKAQVRKGIVNA
jgi:hypothetical protein